MNYYERILNDARKVNAEFRDESKFGGEMMITFTQSQLFELMKLEWEYRKEIIDHRKINWKPYDPDCDCGCNVPTFTEPLEALEFLAGRMEFAGAGEAVAESYARDLRKILASTNIISNDEKLKAARDGISHNIADFENFKFLGFFPIETIDIILNRNKKLLEKLRG
jgi:hypothetical protein